jgi:hypothetical protein
MLKLIEHLVKFITLLLIAILMVSCKYTVDLGENSITGNGKVKTEERSLDTFTKIKVTQGLECELIQSNTQKVVVEADDNLIKGIKTEVKNGTLIISSDYNNYINITSKKVKVQIPLIEELISTSGSTLTTKSTIKGSSLVVDSSSGSELNVSAEYDSITASSSSGSELTIGGKALKAATNSSSGSSIDAENLLANDITAQSSSGSSTEVHPLVSLTAKASSGSSIDYSGKPKTIDKDESSGGSVDEK